MRPKKKGSVARVATRKKGGTLRSNVGNRMLDTGDPALTLIAAIVRRAIDDSLKGSAEAQAFLNGFYPEWRKWLKDERLDRQQQRTALPELRQRRRVARRSLRQTLCDDS